MTPFSSPSYWDTPWFSMVYGTPPCKVWETQCVQLPCFCFWYFCLFVFWLHCCMEFSLVAMNRGYLCGVQPSHCGGFSCCSRACRPSSCGIWVWLLHGIWNLPGPGVEAMSPALDEGFLSTMSPGKSCSWYFWWEDTDTLNKMGTCALELACTSLAMFPDWVTYFGES